MMCLMLLTVSVLLLFRIYIIRVFSRRKGWRVWCVITGEATCVFSLFRLTENFLSSEVSGENSRATTSELSGRTESTFNTGRGIGETRFFFDLQEESSNKSAANRYIIFFIFSNIRSAKIDKKAKIYVFCPIFVLSKTDDRKRKWKK